ncbi:MAG: chromosome segregation protein [Thermotogaceae bacterium]|nr:chromosome segregation protein [Thermotogaceae bacterium]
MKLKKIIIDGFKSFGRPVSINISENITAIVGPNGSGKSNVVDAIRWVFGEHSYKNLRTVKKNDILFSGSNGTSASNRAYVKLIFEDDGKEIDVSREMLRDGKNIYMLNGEVVRLKDLMDFFAGTGAGKEFYSIIAQGQIDKIVNATPEELRKLIEEAAGIFIYKVKKKETLQNLETTMLNLQRVEDVLKELEREMKSLYLKAKRAEKYKEYSDELSKIQVRYFSDAINRTRRKLLDLDETINGQKENLRDLLKELAQLEQKWMGLRQEFGEVDKEIEDFTKTLEKYKERQNSLLEIKESFSKRLSDFENQYIENTMKINSIKDNIENLQNRKNELKLILENLSQKINELLQNLKTLNEQKEELYSKYSEEEKEAMKLQAEIEETNRRLMKLDNEKIRIEDSIEDFKNRLQLVENQINVKSSKLIELQKELQNLYELGKVGSEKERELTEQIQSLESEILKFEEYAKKIEAEKRQLLEKKMMTESKIRAFESEINSYSGFSRAVKELFAAKKNGGFDKVIDVVANIIDVENDYSKAIEALLGGRLQNVVVEDSEAAKEAIEFLKNRRAGRITFLPLDLLEIQNFRDDSALKEHEGFIGYAKDLVKTSKEYSIIPDYLFGNAIVVRNLDDAIEIRKVFGFKGRIATLDGELLERGGALTGGYSLEDEKFSLMNRRNMLKQLKENLADLERKLEEVNLKWEENELELQDLNDKKAKAEKALNKLLLKNESLKRTILEINSSVKELEKELNNLRRLERDYNSRIEGYSSRLENIKTETLELSKKLQELNEKFGSYSDSIKARKSLIEDLENKISEMKFQYESFKERYDNYDTEYRDIEKKINSLESEAVELKNATEKLEIEIQQLKAKINEIETELKSIKKDTNDLFEAIKLQREGKEKKIREMEELESQIEQLKQKREELRENLHSMELMKQETQIKYQNLYDNVSNSGIPFEELDENLILDEVEREQLENDMNELIKKMKFLGNVDMEAIEEYQKVEERYQELNLQREDLLKAKKSLEEVIQKTEEEAKKVFLETFNSVNSNFSEMIEELFEGAKGEMRLLPEKDVLETGIEISIKKVGKKEQNLYLLSGGEKSLVGIALLFSLLKINPSPFYILDEVDAALDDYNAERLGRLIKRYSDKTQFIVVTHNKLVMENADILHGITMTNGISTIVPVELEKVADDKPLEVTT